MIVIVEDDVMFQMPLKMLADSVGQKTLMASSWEDALSLLEHHEVQGLVVSMRLVQAEWLTQLGRDVPIAAYGPHVDGAQFLAFRDKGVRDVWPNSQLRPKFALWLRSLSS